nr:RNA-directed DNA polymerase, eukaryota [Tanacetum cinerariifolium]
CCWSLEGSQEFSVKSSRILIDNTILPKAKVPTRWLRVIPIKVNVHAWKVCLDKLPNRANLSLRRMDIPSIACPICVKSWFSKLTQASNDFITEGRIVWVEIEGSRDVDSKIKNLETCGDDSDLEEVQETVFEEKWESNHNVDENCSGLIENHSEDPFGFTPNVESDKLDVNNEDNSNKIGHTGKSIDLKLGCSSHFKQSEIPCSGGSILNLMEELVKMGQTMGYNMNGCINSITQIIESQEAAEVHQ